MVASSAQDGSWSLGHLWRPGKQGPSRQGLLAHQTDTGWQLIRERVPRTELCFPDSCVEALASSVTLCGDGACKR